MTRSGRRAIATPSRNAGAVMAALVAAALVAALVVPVVALAAPSGVGPASAVTGTNVISTVAGGLRTGPNDARGTAVTPYAMATYGSTVFLFDAPAAVIRAVDRKTGIQRVVAGNGSQTLSGDGGPAIEAGIGGPDYLWTNRGFFGLAVDGGGQLFFSGHGVLRRIDNAGIITTVAEPVVGPVGTDGAGNILVAAQCQVSRLAGDGTLTPVAGTGACAESGDGGPATAAELQSVYGVAADGAGGLFISTFDADSALAGHIRRVAADGTISTYAQVLTLETGAWPLAVSPDGRPILASGGGPNRVSAVADDGSSVVIAGGGSDGGDGIPATTAAVGAVTALASADDGSLLIADRESGRVRLVAGGVITTVIGLAAAGGFPDGPAAQSQLGGPAAVAAMPGGDVVVADGRIRRITPTGLVGTVPSAEGAESVAVGPNGALYYLAASHVHRLDPDGTDTVVAGGGTGPDNGDGGPATEAWLQYPRGVAVDHSGVLYVSEPIVSCFRYGCIGAGVIRRIGADGIISTVVSIAQGGALAIDGDDNLFYTSAQRVYRRAVGGAITHVAGGPWASGGGPPGGDGGPAIDAPLDPTALAVSPSGDLFIGETWRVRVVSPDGVISTVADNPTRTLDSSGDGGSALQAGFRCRGLTVAADGTVYVADAESRRVRAVSPAAPPVAPAPPVGTPRDGEVALSWSSPSASDLGVTGYRIAVAPGGQTIDVGADSTTRVSGLANGTPYTFTVAARSAAGLSPPSAPSTPVTPVAAGTPASRFHAVTPFRVLDSRTTRGGFDGPVAAGAPRTLTVAPAGGPTGVPATARAVVMNVTVTSGSQDSLVSVFPNGMPLPTVSSVNFGAGQVVPNLVTATVGSGGQVRVANLLGAVHVVVDVLGYYDEGAGDLFDAVAPTRLLDSRTSTGGWSGPLGPGEARSLAVRGAAGVPPSATAVVMNLTITEPTQASYLQVYPASAVRPLTANLLFAPGQTVANLVVVGIGADGAVDLFNQRGTTQVVADVVGYFDVADGAAFRAVAPVRLLDSRLSGGPAPWDGTPIGPAASRTMRVAGVAGIPAGAVGLAANVTVTEGSQASYLTVSPTPGPIPAPTANLLFGPGQTTANAVMTGLGVTGDIDLFDQLGTVHVVVDATGYFSVE